MKANISLARGITTNKHYLVINHIFHITISKKIFYELADFLSIKVGK